METENTLRPLTQEENTLIDSFSMNESQKERVTTVWGKSLEPLAPVPALPSPKGIRVVLNEKIFLILILINAFLHIHISGLITFLGWFMIVGTVFAMGAIKRLFRSHVFMTLSPAGLRIYYNKMTWKYYFSHAVKIATLLMLWYIGKETLSIAWLFISLYGVHSANTLKSIIKDDLDDRKDFTIDTMDNYSFKNLKEMMLNKRGHQKSIYSCRDYSCSFFVYEIANSRQCHSERSEESLHTGDSTLPLRSALNDGIITIY